MNPQKVVKPALIFLAFISLFISCSEGNRDKYISSEKIRIDYNEKMQSKISLPELPQTKINDQFSKSEYLIIDSDTLFDFDLTESTFEGIEDFQKLKLSGTFSSSKIKIRKVITASIDKNFPDFVITKVKYINEGNNNINIKGWVNNSYMINASDTNKHFWSYQSGSYESRPDWVLPVTDGFDQANYMGMNASDYGGGTPVSDVWRKDVGIAVGHLELTPKLVSLPVKKNVGGGVSLAVSFYKAVILKPGDTLSTFETFISVHHGDYFTTLNNYSLIMQKKGIKFEKISDSAYEPVWCAWGYERNFTTDKVINTLPKVKELGYKWAVLDDGWQTAEGDWYLNPKKFPRGDSDMKAFVNKIHANGLKAKLWWAPLAVDPGTDLIKQHEDVLLLNEQGKPQDISWWDSYYLCPAYEGTIQHTKKLVEKIIGEWGYEGLKIDGQHLNGAPPCYNPKHHHKYPEESVEAMPAFFKMIYETALSINPDAVVEVCPCGTAYSYFMLPYINQAVSSDPTSSWQIRLKGKTIKALMGPSAPYYGDHVELSDNMDDFASTVGIGGIVGTKFTWPVGAHLNKETGDVSLTPKKEIEWKKWVNIYESNMLPKGIYLGNLYDIGFDKPEAHVIKKDGSFYYAFYAHNFNGPLELRGLESNSNYLIVNYEDNKELGEISGKNPNIKIEFNNHLLLKVSIAK